MKVLTLARLGLGQYETRRRPFPSFRQVTPRDVAVTNPQQKERAFLSLRKAFLSFPESVVTQVFQTLLTSFDSVYHFQKLYIFPKYYKIQKITKSGSKLVTTCGIATCDTTCE